MTNGNASAKPSRVLFILGGAALALVLAAVVFVLMIDMDAYKPRIEAAASDATGLEVRINGKMGLSFFPFGISARDIHVANRGDEILSLEDLKLGAEWMPLLMKQLRVTHCELVKPAVTIVKGTDGKYNFESKGQPGAAFNLDDLTLSNGSFVYLDKKTGEQTEFKDVNLAIKDLSVAGNVIKNASFTGTFDCKEVLQKNKFKIEKLTASVKAVKGIYNFEPLRIGHLVHFDKKAGEKTELTEITLAMKDLTVVEPSGRIIRDIVFTGDLDCREIQKNDLKIANVKSTVKVDRGFISLTALTMDMFGTKAEGDATADKTQDDAVYKINLKVSKLDFDKLEESFKIKKVVGGKGDLSASFTMKEKGSRNLMSSLNGTFSLRGDQLIIYTMDLDKVLYLMRQARSSISSTSALFSSWALSVPLRSRGIVIGTFTTRHREGGAPSLSSSPIGRSKTVWQTLRIAPFRRSTIGLH